MENVKLVQAAARLEAFSENLPVDDVDERYVSEYHDILKKLEGETGLDLGDFLVGKHHLEHDHRNRLRCDREYFNMKLRGLLKFFAVYVNAKWE